MNALPAPLAGGGEQAPIDAASPASPRIADLFGSFSTASQSRPALPPEDGLHGRGARRVHASPRGFIAVDAGAAPTAICAQDGIAVAVYGLGGGTHAVHSMASSSPSGTPRSMALEVLEEYRTRGARVLDTFVHPAALVVWDERSQRLLLAVDRLGVQQLFVVRSEGGISFATSATLAASLAASRPAVSRQAIFDYVYFHALPSPVSMFEGVTRLGPGECIAWQDGEVESTRYWQPVFEEHHRRGFGDLREEFVGDLLASVRDAVDGARCGAFLSGGTDSSTIAGMMVRVGGVASTYSIGFAAEGYDEMEYARIAARHFGTAHHEYYVSADDVVDAIPAIAAIHDQPFGNSSSVPAYYCARMAASDGMERMIAGDGGDELFGGNARYATQRTLSIYEKVPRILRTALIQPASRRLPRSVPPLRKVRSYVEQASVPMPERTETYNLLRNLGHDTVFTDELLAAVDATQPLALQTRAYFNPSARTLINRQLALDMKFTLADNDLRKVVRSCELAGLPVAFPFLDHRVVDFALKLDPELKLRGTQLRYFFKRALADFLPERIIRKTKHGFGLPFGQWAVSHPRLRELAFDSIHDLSARNIFRRAMIDRMPSLLNEHPAYYGSWLWVLMMLEQWFKHHAPATRLG